MNYAARLSDIRLALNRATIRLSSWSKPHAEVPREPRLPNVRMESYRLLLAFIKEKKLKLVVLFCKGQRKTIDLVMQSPFFF